jgi:hypothetical protein
MTYQGSNVELPCLFPSIQRMTYGNQFQYTPARSHLTWEIVFQNNSPTLSQERPTTSISASREFAAYYLGVWECAAGAAFLMDFEVVAPLSSPVCRSRARRLLAGTRAYHSARQ